MSGFEVQSLGFMVVGSVGLWVQGLGFRVLGLASAFRDTSDEFGV